MIKNFITHENRRENDNFVRWISNRYINKETITTLFKNLYKLPDLLFLEELMQYFSVIPNDYITICLIRDIISSFLIEERIRITKWDVYYFLYYLLDCSNLEDDFVCTFNNEPDEYLFHLHSLNNATLKPLLVYREVYDMETTCSIHHPKEVFEGVKKDDIKADELELTSTYDNTSWLFQKIPKQFLSEEKMTNIFNSFEKLPDIISLSELKRTLSVFPDEWIIYFLIVNLITAFEVDGHLRIIKSEVSTFLMQIAVMNSNVEFYDDSVQDNLIN